MRWLVPGALVYAQMPHVLFPPKPVITTLSNISSKFSRPSKSLSLTYIHHVSTHNPIPLQPPQEEDIPNRNGSQSSPGKGQAFLFQILSTVLGGFLKGGVVGQ
jgi:hypothetical protein